MPATVLSPSPFMISQKAWDAGVRETTPCMGTFTFEVNGKSHTVVLIGKDTSTGVQPVARVRDKTSGPITYAPAG